jgi:hypothetical protein
LFLLPLPWWGPVLAPCCIATLMILWGTYASQCVQGNTTRDLTRMAVGSSVAGIALALYVFMADALRALYERQNVALVLPAEFNWWLFSIALMLMAVPLAESRRT